MNRGACQAARLWVVKTRLACMSPIAMLGIILQLLGTVLTGVALWGELGDRQPKVRPPERPQVKNPWKGEWRSSFRSAPGHEVRDWLRRTNDRSGLLGRRGEVHPEVVSLARYMSQVFKETRTDLGSDWQRQERDQAELHAATVALFDSFQEAHAATRQRVRLEMVGLFIVAVGTVLSSF